ncbi:hypothetical protein [uncultured Sphingomonas sp.]|uniref:hypothetical protein n=1 Tax=uncultured Sphingomonas sp. TaxID=158754 RepID=UPI0035CCA5BB
MTRSFTLAPFLVGGLLSACAAPTARPAPAAPVAPAFAAIGLERVLGQDAAGLVRLFGEADADMREGDARKLQFESGICVLDAYLYPNGGSDPRVTYLDAREPDGSPIDRASCVAAMTRRGAVK